MLLVVVRDRWVKAWRWEEQEGEEKQKQQPAVAEEGMAIS
jgi:hypothetical protein